jgi:hypothetical protein
MQRPNPDLSNVRAWCAQHPSMVAAFAVSMVSVGRHAASMVRIGEKTNHGSTLPMYRNLDHWLGLYRNHRGLLRDMASFGSAIPDISALIGLAGHLMADLHALPDDIDDVRDPLVEACGQRMLALLFAVHADTGDVQPEPALDVSDPRFVAVWFYLCVTLPSLLLYGTSPGALFRQARHGNLIAIARLMTLDRHVRSDPAVSRAIFGDPVGWALVCKEIPARVPARRPLRWKVMAAATARTASMEFKSTLTHQALADLYHAFARDCDGASEDRDLGSLQSRTFERQVAASIQSGKALLALPMTSTAGEPAPVNEQVSRERIRSSSKGS